MNAHQLLYYYEMLRRSRLIPLKYDGKFIGIITFFIGDGNPEKYIRDDSWSVVDDEPNGDVCYVDHVIGNKHNDNRQYALRAYRDFKEYIREHFPRVQLIRGNRWKHNRLFIDKRRLA